jgi:hypothetical protein
LLGVGGTEYRQVLTGLEVTVYPDAGWVIGGDVEVGTSRIHHPLQ